MEPVKTEPTPVGVIVGRFQLDELHEAHKELINAVVARHSKVIIVLGVARRINTKRNPLDFQMRLQMIQSHYPDVLIVPNNDCRDDIQWSNQLDNLIRTVAPNQNATLYGARDSFIPHYKGKFKVQEMESDTIMAVSGNAVRKRLSTKAVNSPEFRAGVIWAAYQHFNRIDATVDVAIFDPTKKMYLFGKKPGETKLRFIGGFADPKSSSFEEDARREVQEETGLEVNIVKYLGSCAIKDWRYRSDQDAIRTTFFLANYQFGAAVAADDIDELQWIPQERVINQNFLKELVEEHEPLLALLFKHDYNGLP